MPFDGDDVRRYLDPERWAAIAQVKQDAWLARWRLGPEAQIRAMDRLRESSRALRGPPTARERDEDLAHHVRLSELMRRADRRD